MWGPGAGPGMGVLNQGGASTCNVCTVQYSTTQYWPLGHSRTWQFLSLERWNTPSLSQGLQTWQMTNMSSLEISLSLSLYLSSLTRPAARRTWACKSSKDQFSWTLEPRDGQTFHNSESPTIPAVSVGFFVEFIIIDVLGVTDSILGWIFISFDWSFWFDGRLCYHIDICWHCCLLIDFSVFPGNLTKQQDWCHTYLIFRLVGGHLRAFLSSMLMSIVILWASLQLVLSSEIRIWTTISWCLTCTSS